MLRGVAFDRVDERQTVAYILDALGAGRGGWAVTSNLDHLRRAGVDAEFRAMLAGADLVVADGKPLVWAAALQGTPLPERVAGSSLVWTLTEGLAAAGRSLFLLGGDPGTAEEAAGVLTQRYRNLVIKGTYCPSPGFEKDAAEVARIEGMLENSGADVVYVALGSPKQEKLIRDIRQALPGAWWIGVGISLSFICGRVRRAPQWMQRLGLEWVHRLGQEPRRLMRRYLVDGIPFAIRLLCSCAGARLTQPKERLTRSTTPGTAPGTTRHTPP